MKVVMFDGKHPKLKDLEKEIRRGRRVKVKLRARSPAIAEVHKEYEPIEPSTLLDGGEAHLAAIKAILEDYFGSPESKNWDDFDIETVPASTRLTVTITLADYDLKLKEVYMDMRANTNYYITVNGVTRSSNEFKPARPERLTSDKIVMVIENLDTVSQTYARYVTGWGNPRAGGS